MSALALIGGATIGSGMSLLTHFNDPAGIGIILSGVATLIIALGRKKDG